MVSTNILTVKNIIFSSNTYILQSFEDNTCVIIDPGLDTEIIDASLIALGSKPIAILATHGHFDHIGSAQFFQTKYQIPYYLHEQDFKMSQSANFFLKIANINHKIVTPVPDVMFIGEKDSCKIGCFLFDIYNFPGHSNGSCILRCGQQIFSGDILYKEGLGLNSFPKENIAQLKKSIRKIMSLFSEDVVIYPGHGESETLGNIKRNNQKLMSFIQQDYDETE